MYSVHLGQFSTFTSKFASKLLVGRPGLDPGASELKARGREFLQFVVTVESLDGANCACPGAHNQ
jgi:hypothetical protein